MQSSANWLVVALIIILIAIGGGWYLSGRNPIPMETPTNGGTTSTTTPNTAETSTPSTTIAQATYKNASAERIVVDTPKPGAMVAKVFTVSGQARGGWYFEANFPYEVLDAQGNRLVQGPVQAQGEWMTANFVPYSFSVTIPGNYIGGATLVLHNDNPSGLPENAASVSIPIVIR